MTQLLLNNRYQILQSLARGGFGETFLAEDTQMPSNRRCVIKQLKPIVNTSQMTDIAQERFPREAAVLEELGEHNDQIPRLYAYFSENGQFYLVQEWVEGITLTHKVRDQGILPENVVLDILVSLLTLLDYIHSKHIIHRDIKPDNIILRQRDGKPVLIDFGAVKETMGVLPSPDGKSNTIMIGTPGFMPAEQANGRPVYASDLYSLGLTAIYMLTGKMPQKLDIDPGSAEILWRHYAPSVSPAFAMVLDQAIKSHPRDRFPTAQAMLNALSPIIYPSVPPLPELTSGLASNQTIPYTSGISSRKVTYPRPNHIPQRSVSPSNSQEAILIGGLIATGVIGAMIVGIIFGIKSSTPSAQSQLESPTTTTLPSASPTQPTTTSPSPKKSTVKKNSHPQSVPTINITLSPNIVSEKSPSPTVSPVTKPPTDSPSVITPAPDHNGSTPSPQVVNTPINTPPIIFPTPSVSPSVPPSPQTPIATSSPVATFQGCQAKVTDPNPPLNVRSEPDANSSIVTTLKNGTKINVIQEKDGWYGYKIQKSKSIGWVAGNRITGNCVKQS